MDVGDSEIDCRYVPAPLRGSDIAQGDFLLSLLVLAYTIELRTKRTTLAILLAVQATVESFHPNETWSLGFETHFTW